MSFSHVDAAAHGVNADADVARQAAAAIDWTVIVPTYRRPEVLRLALERLVHAGANSNRFEVIVLDNGAPDVSQTVAESFGERLPLRYVRNDCGHGLGYSLSKGADLAEGEFVMELNDDALVPKDVFENIREVFLSDPAVGVVGVRASEEGYVGEGTQIGVVDSTRCRIVGNFHLPTEAPIDVEHVYGFCYAYRRELLLRGGKHDSILLGQDYSSGNRIETDHCLTARKLGFRVVYDGRVAVEHLAKPRGDMSERSTKWKINDTRNTLYLYLKHFGWLGRRGLAFRYCFVHDLGVRSALLHPSRKNWVYCLIGIRARGSAIWHWAKFLCSRKRLRPIHRGG